MTYDWETARPTDLWNFLFMFRFNNKKKKKNLSCVAFLHSSVRNCSRKLWKIEVWCTWKCLQPGWKSRTPRSTGGSCHFLIFPSSACHSSPPSHCGEEANARMIIICFSPSALFFRRQGAEASVPTLNEPCAPSCCRAAPFPYQCWWGLFSTPPKSLCSAQASKESELHDMLCVCDEDNPCSCCSPCSTVLDMSSVRLGLCCLQTLPCLATGHTEGDFGEERKFFHL